MNAEDLVRDISLFSDPATPVEALDDGDRLRIQLIRNGDDRDYFFDLKTGRVNARHDGQRYSSLASLLSSEEFADLRRFSATQRRVLGRKNLESLIDPSGTVNPAGAATPFSLEVGRELFRPSSGGALSLILIDGPAGVGKTSFIERMVYERTAEPSLPPILHITSKGRRLSNLPDAIGKTASDLDARFRSEQVPVLVRLNALQLAIDGFDELVQPDGYGNAWGALKDLLRSIGSAGPVILAGRDTFFDQQDITQQLEGFGSKVDLTMLRLSEVPVHATEEWLISKGWSAEEIRSPRVMDFFRRPYTRRPFFLSQIAEVKDFDSLPIGVGSPQQILISKLLDREANLLKPGLAKAEGEEIIEALNNLCEEMASDMADRESESVSVDFLEFMAEYSFAGIASEDELNAITKKAGSMALLESVEGARECRFPHSEIQNHFLAQAIARSLEKGEVFAPLRGVLYGADVIEAFADVVRSIPSGRYDVIQRQLWILSREERFSARLRSNVSALQIACLVRGNEQEPLNLSGVEINEIRVFDQLAPAKLVNVVVSLLDARGADLSQVEFIDSNVNHLIVDNTTRFGGTFPICGTLQIQVPESLRSIHDQKAIQDWLLEHSELHSDEDDWSETADLPLVKYFDRLCRRFLRQHYIRDVDTDDGAQLIRDPRWTQIADILGDRVSVLHKDAQGGPDAFYHMQDPEDLLWPEDREARRLRMRVVELAKAS